MSAKTLEELVVAAAESVRPPERLTVAEAAEKYRKMNNPGSYVGPYTNTITPYLVEPEEILTSLDYSAEIFVGPAQAAKTDYFLNWLTYTTICDPADMMMVHPKQASARDFSMRRIRRLFRHTEEVGRRLVPGRNNQNTFDFHFQSGFMVTLNWPTVSELSGKPVQRIWLTDYDRMPEDVETEGTPFDLARKRATSFGPFGMTVAESSPGREMDRRKWIPQTSHEAPPTTGILALYNRGDRRRWFWPCPHCGTPFEPEFHLLLIPDSRDQMEAAEQTVMGCPKCGGIITHDGDAKLGVAGKFELNLAGRWVMDGQTWDGKRVTGTPYRSNIASFWLKGPAAAMSDWKTLALNWLKANEEFERTGSTTALKSTVNLDQGLPFNMPLGADDRLPETIKATARDFGDKVVPAGVRFLEAAIDIQRSRFVVQVHGFGVRGDQWLIDRFDIKKSARLDEDKEHYMVAPGAYPEDWHLIVPQVLLKTYPLSDDSGRHMQIKGVACDSGGRQGVTKNAYGFWRWLRDEYRGEQEGQLHRRFQLVKGLARGGSARVQLMYPDSDRKDRHAGAMGEIPVLMIDTNAIKDANNAMLDRKDSDGGRICFPDWLSDEFYVELTAERRTLKGWENPNNLRNEAWDLWCYLTALSLSRLVSIEKIDWDNPPPWAGEWDQNDLVFAPSAEKRFAGKAPVKYSLGELAELLT